MRIFMAWFVISTLFSSIGLEALRGANFRMRDRFELLILVFPGCSANYVLLSSFLLEVNEEIKDSSTYKDLRKFLQDTILKRLTIFAVSAAVLEYFGFSFNFWLSCLLFAVWILLRELKPHWCASRSLLSWSLFSLHLFFPEVFVASMVSLVPCFHLLIAEPFFKTSIATSSMAAQAYRQRRYIEIICGMLANALTAYYLKFQSEDLMLAFLSFAIASLGIYANFKPSTDFGIIQFLVTSSIQCAVSRFGLLHAYTALVLLVGFAVMVLRWKMESGHYFVEQESWEMKLWPYLQKTEGAAAYLSPILVILPAFSLKESGNVHHFVILSLNAVYFRVLRRKYPFPEYSQTGEEIYATVWNLKWWHDLAGNSGNPTMLHSYIHFRDILHRLLQHICRHTGDPTVPKLPVL